MFNEEGILNKVVTAAVIGLLGWNVMTTQRLAVDVAVLAEKVETTLKNTATKLETVTLENRIESLELRLEKIEDAGRN